MCTENDFKNYGHAKVFPELLTDLKELEENGITMGDEQISSQTEFLGADLNICRLEQMLGSAPRSAIKLMETEDAPQVQGIKFRSVFNALQNFDFCSPGMPPCLSNDIFEGALSSDVALYLKYLINKTKWFTYTILNRRVRQFKYKATDACSKPFEFSPQHLKLS